MRWAALLFLSGPLFSAECLCPTASPQDLFETATSVFRGSVDEIQTSGKNSTRYLFIVNDTFKGETQTEIILQDAGAGTPCELTFEKNKEYLVYVRWEWGLLKTSQCWGTKVMDQAKADQAIIGPGNEWKEKVYPKLREACMGTYQTPCCLSSVKAMEQGHFLPEPESGCTDGMKPNVAHCLGSLRWCEPIAGNPAYHP